jgi:hypothetical protein
MNRKEIAIKYGITKDTLRKILEIIPETKSMKGKKLYPKQIKAIEKELGKMPK